MVPSQRKIAGVTGVLLAGGQSKRMGQDKRFLELDGESLVARAVRLYRTLFDDIVIVVAKDPERFLTLGTRVVTDVVPDCGSLGGLYTGLASAHYPRIFAAACDMPFLNPVVVRAVTEFEIESDVVMVRLVTGLQPTHGVYRSTCLPHMKAMIDARDLTIQNLLTRSGLHVTIVPEERIRPLDPQLLSFLNVNTPSDLEFARKLIAERAGGSATW